MIGIHTSTLIAPYGGSLRDLVVPAEMLDERKAYASHLPSLQISPQAVCDLELLASGAYSPLDRFMGQEDTRRVLAEMRLSSGAFFPMPITLAVEPTPDLRLDREVALRGSSYELLGIMNIEEIFSGDSDNPLLVNISGGLMILSLPSHYDFRELRLTPAQVRERLEAAGRRNVFAYQTGEALPRLDAALLGLVTGAPDGALLVQLSAGPRKPGDFDAYNRVRLYQRLVDQCGVPDRVMLSLLPRAAETSGPRETLMQALIARNYGANHLITSGEIDEGDAQELDVTFVPEPGRNNVAEADLLAELRPPRHQQGVCVWFTGLSGSGKSTTAEILSWLMMEHGRRVTVLDGDVVRTHLSKGLGFSKEDRDTNVRRIGFVASELVRIGGVVICSVVSPYRAARADVRSMVGNDNFVEVFVDTPLDVCESRDVKGMYAKARSGALKGFTGIDDPYEPPLNPEITLDTVNNTPQENAERIIAYLIEQGFLKATT